MINWGDVILFLIALVVSITVHEFGHAWAATRLGDSLPRLQGRLTLNPKQHVDPVGTLLFPLIVQLTGAPLLGWGRPVQTNPNNYTRSVSRSTGHMLVAIAGPAMNLVLALLVSIGIVVIARAGLVDPYVAFDERGVGALLIRNLVVLNLSLMFFNLLPIPPLDGGAVLAWFLPRSLQGVMDFLNRWGFVILLGLMVTKLLGELMRPAYAIIRLWTGVLLRASIG